MATKACVAPLGMLGAGGVTAMLRRRAAVTASVAVAEIAVAGSVAVIDVVPTDADEATPSVPAALEMVATVVVDDVHVTLAVSARVVPSLNVPVATNACDVPLGMLGEAGVMARLRSTAAVTLSVVDAAIPEAGSVAAIVVLPTDAAVATPRVPGAFEMLATDGADDVQVTDPVSVCVEPSLNVPVATKACVEPFGTAGDDGVIAIERRTAAVTLSVALPEIPVPGSVAVRVVVPTESPDATPSLPAALEIVATATAEDVQLTIVVSGLVVPSL